jgi:hypothetical protein
MMIGYWTIEFIAPPWYWAHGLEARPTTFTPHHRGSPYMLALTNGAPR